MIRHHPSPEVLSDYARGALPAGMMLVVSCHLHSCDTCRREIAMLESAGGALLLAAAPEALANDALARALARIDSGVEPAPRPAKNLPEFLKRFPVPQPLRDQDIGSQLWLTPSIWFAPVRFSVASRSRTYLVYAKENTALPEHTHRGREYTAVLCGSFQDGAGTFAQGDFEEADDSLSHAPAVTAQSECLCVISADAPMQLHGRIARVIQALAGKLY
jgi:putative transcriptional regulator